jgi:hypothetical protein
VPTNNAGVGGYEGAKIKVKGYDVLKKNLTAVHSVLVHVEPLFRTLIRPCLIMEVG